jgi:hypothetical protein
MIEQEKAKRMKYCKGCTDRTTCQIIEVTQQGIICPTAIICTGIKQTADEVIKGLQELVGKKP